MYNKAWHIYSKSKDKQEIKQAFEIFQECAKVNYKQADYFLGMMYKKGKGTQKNYKNAFSCFRHAAKRGNSQAAIQMGLMYKYGQYKKQNYKKAFKIFQNEIDRPNHGYALFQLGNMYYKGLGCEQDYKKAFDLYYASNKKNSVNGSNALAFCYRYGLGTEKNLESAQYHLSRLLQVQYPSTIKSLELRPSHELLLNPDPEDPLYNYMDKTFTTINQPYKHENISGTYKGLLLTYDYSGKILMNQHDIKLKIQQKNKNINILWIENDTLKVNLIGKIKKYAVDFSKADYKRFETSVKKYPVKYEFRKATFTKLEGEKIVLKGNIIFYVPGRYALANPMSFVIEKIEK
ncbi:tetratricopeptide repeat protein [Saccharicrinis sp. FJH2]|uniref:tetratricopeptide repeat protein n=1 Tax=Saccharicrinis sp. FJH65 TaxID=3344659 RepID=UPI0035F2E4C1